MKIDLHCHTKKTKKGDPETRNVIPSKFASVLSTNGVGIVSITNHNYFNYNEYCDFVKESEAFDIQVWPGVELDVSVEGESGHILVISNPDRALEFEEVLKNMFNNKNPDAFSIDYKSLLNEIKRFDGILIAHYALFKEHGFSDKAINSIKGLVNEDSTPILLEPSSLKSVGIMEANGLDSIIGSDVKDWSNYPSSKIPSLKMPIKNFNTFKLLLKKDRNTVDTFINQKEKKSLTIKPFSDEKDLTEITLDIYNDVNIIFGGKATGKSKIISSLYNYYCSQGKSNLIAYYKANDTIEQYNTITKVNIDDKLFANTGFSNCENEIKNLKEFKPCDIVTTDKFYKGIKSINAKGNITKFGFFTARYSYVSDDSLYEKSIEDYAMIKNAYKNLSQIHSDDYIERNIYDEILEKIFIIGKKAFEKAKDEWIKNKSNYYVEWTISKMKDIGKTKTGETALPSNTGICQFYSKLKELKQSTDKVCKELSKNRKTIYSLIGLLPDNKEIYLCVNCYINPYEDRSEGEKIKFLGSTVSITALKSFKKAIVELAKSIYTSKVTAKIDEFIKSSIHINSLKDCFYASSYTVKKTNNGYEVYNPSSGEKSMLQISNVFSDSTKDIFLLDEPELSVGHNYINKVVVPKIRELSKLDKTIIISTHDANIAVRTLPLNTIYREYKKTFMGNLFLDELRNIEDGTVYSWTEKSLDYLEGGEDAFIERGDSYGL